MRAAPATMDMLAGVVDSNVEALTNAVPNVTSGQYRALAVLSNSRQPLLPEVPSLASLGVIVTILVIVVCTSLWATRDERKAARVSADR